MEKLALLFGKEEINYYLFNNILTTDMRSLNLKVYTFDSKIERLAFMKGIDEGIGWQEVYQLEENNK